MLNFSSYSGPLEGLRSGTRLVSLRKALKADVCLAATDAPSRCHLLWKLTRYHHVTFVFDRLREGTVLDTRFKRAHNDAVTRLGPKAGAQASAARYHPRHLTWVRLTLILM